MSRWKRRIFGTAADYPDGRLLLERALTVNKRLHDVVGDRRGKQDCGENP